MAIRGDISVNWNTSPRIITVAKPSTECSMQDLLDTLRYLEAQFNAMDEPSIVSASGKEPLGGGVKVGLTVSLLNAKIAFEGRDVADGWTLCNLQGGNLVAFDSLGGEMDSIQPTSYVTVAKTSSASATLQEQGALQYSSFDGGVSIDFVNGISGTDFPAGTVEHPVNNLIDAKAIAVERGFDRIWLNGNMFITGDDDISDYSIINRSDNPTKSIVVVDASANTTGVQIKRCAVSGTLDNGVILEECITMGINYINGYLKESILASYEIVLGGNEPAFLINCQSGVPNALRTQPSIDLGGSGQALVMSGFDGEISLVNKTGNDVCSIRMTGQLRVDSATCIAGNIEVFGDCYITDENGDLWVNGVGKSNVIDMTTGTKEEIADSVWNKVIP